MNARATHPSLAAALAAALLMGGAPAPNTSETDDRRIESSFTQSHVYRTYLKSDAVVARAKDGVVTLTGSAAGAFHKALAQDTAASLPGVTLVDNQLVTKAEVAEDPTDARISSGVRLALLFHRNVDSDNTRVEVKAGVVTLRGEASSTAQLELTTEYAGDIDGVKEVRNEMTVAKSPPPVRRTVGEQIDDASITAQVKLALLTHRSTSATQTKVETRNGNVNVTGIAKNAAEKTLVTKLVADIQGVTSVKNQMTLEAAKAP